MKITVWGCRGSLPTPGRNTLRYGGNTTCLEILLNDGTLIVLDAGSGMRKLGKKLVKEQGPNEMYLFLTHSHWDHLMGFPFFVPGYLDRYTIKVRGGPKARRSLRAYLKHQMEPPYFPVRFDAMKAHFDFAKGDPEKKTIGSATVVPIRLNHPNGGYGFKFVEDGRSFVFLTDNELTYGHDGGLTVDEYISFCDGADLLFHDAQYTDEEYRLTRGWGHTRFDTATDLAVRAQVKRFGLFHHDPDHTDDAMDGFVAGCSQRIAKSGARIDCFGVQEGMEIDL